MAFLRWETVAFLIVGLIIGGLAGYIVFTTIAKPQVGGEVRTFYVLATEWKFTLYDASFKPIDRITVNKGDRVVLVFIPATFIPHELYEDLEHEFVEDAVKKGLLKSGEEFEEKEEEAKKTLGLARSVYGVEFIPHGLAISGYEDKVNVNTAEGKPVVVSFTADKVGEFDIYCSLFCGWGHGFMKLEKAFVVKG